MYRVILSCFCATLLCLGGKPLVGQSLAESHAKIELVSEESSFRPGKMFWVGLLFHLESGWHIYWQNPGDSGEPPTVQWDLPKGFRVGAIRWPVPTRLGSKTIVDYGYEGQVLLMVPVQTPQNPAAAPAAITARVKYLICREICIPVKTQVNLYLSHAKDSAAHFSASRQLFQQTRTQFPQKAPDAWKTSALSRGDAFILAIGGAKAPITPWFLPLDSDVIENSAPQTLDLTSQGFRLTLQKSNLLEKPISTLKGVLVIGPGNSYEVAAPVTRAK